MKQMNYIKKAIPVQDACTRRMRADSTRRMRADVCFFSERVTNVTIPRKSLSFPQAALTFVFAECYNGCTMRLSVWRIYVPIHQPTYAKEGSPVKKLVSLLLALALTLSCVTALAASKSAKYSMSTENVTVLQDVPDREINYNKDDLAVNPVIPGESPTTGLPVAESDRYMPMLVQVANELPKSKFKYNGVNTISAGVYSRAPWGGQYADIVYEGVLYRTGETRMTFLFNDSFAEGQPVSVGPIRSARYGHALLREEWGGGLVFGGGPRAQNNNITSFLKELGALEKKAAMDLVHTNDYNDYASRVDGLQRPNNLNADIVGLRSTIPETTVATPHPFLFTDECPYTDGYETAYSINLDWGSPNWISHFYYDENENLYLRYSGIVPYSTYADGEASAANSTIKSIEDREMEQMSFSNVIVQRVPYEFANGSYDMPQMQSAFTDGTVAKGNADIFIGGRYIPGYWVRESVSSPTVYFDNKGNEIQLTRGKTFIADFPPEALLTYGMGSAE